MASFPARLETVERRPRRETRRTRMARERGAGLRRAWGGCSGSPSLILAAGLIVLVVTDSGGQVLGLDTDSFGNLVYLGASAHWWRAASSPPGSASARQSRTLAHVAAGDPGLHGRL